MIICWINVMIFFPTGVGYRSQTLSEKFRCTRALRNLPRFPQVAWFTFSTDGQGDKVMLTSSNRSQPYVVTGSVDQTIKVCATVICCIYQLTRSSALTFSGVGMSLDTGASGGDKGGEGVGETLFWGQSGATVHKWGLYEVGAGLAVPSHLVSDIGSVSQPLDQQRLF